MLELAGASLIARQRPVLKPSATEAHQVQLKGRVRVAKVGLFSLKSSRFFFFFHSRDDLLFGFLCCISGKSIAGPKARKSFRSNHPKVSHGTAGMVRF